MVEDDAANGTLTVSLVKDARSSGGRSSSSGGEGGGGGADLALSLLPERVTVPRGRVRDAAQEDAKDLAEVEDEAAMARLQQCVFFVAV